MAGHTYSPVHVPMFCLFPMGIMATWRITSIGLAYVKYDSTLQLSQAASGITRCSKYGVILPWSGSQNVHSMTVISATSTSVYFNRPAYLYGCAQSRGSLVGPVGGQ